MPMPVLQGHRCLLALLALSGCELGDAIADDAGPATADAGQGDAATEDGAPGEDAAPGEPGLYLRGARVITVVDEAPLEGYAVEVRGQRIAAVAPEQPEVPAELEVVDLDGMTLLPGFVDCHVHLNTDEEDTQAQLDSLLDHGVTAVKDVGSRLDGILALRREIDAGSRAGPRITAVGPAFTAPGGHPAATMWSDDPELVAEALRLVDDPEVARQEVRALAAAGVDQIKAVMTDCFGRCARLDPAVLAAIVDEAHRLSLRVMVHTDSLQDVEDALAAGVDGLEHGFTVASPDADLLARLVAANVFVVPTLEMAASYSPSTLQELIERLAAMRAAGVAVAVGTDYSPGPSFHLELELMLEAGYAPLEILTAATLIGAIHLEREHELGSIEPGKLADLIALEVDPLADMAATADVAVVIQGGRVVRPAP